MTSVITKYFNLLCIIFVLFGINIIKVNAESEDCGTFRKAMEYIRDGSLKESTKKELNCCFLNQLVKCDENENIISIELKTRDVKDVESIISLFTNLQNLNSLTINYAEIETIPSSVQKIKELKELILSDNKIRKIPEFFKDMVNLEKLDLSRNKIETIPSFLKYMKNLTYLSLSYNEIEGYIPFDLLEMEQLESFYLAGNKKLDGYVPPFINLSDCNFSDTDLCTLKDEKCRAPIQCYKEEIEEGNKHNGSPDPNMFVDRAITDSSDRNVMGGNKYTMTITIIIIVVVLIGAIWLCWHCAPEYVEVTRYEKVKGCIIS